MPLLARDREPPMTGDHILVAAQLIGVASWASEHLRPPGGDVRAVLLAHPARKVRRQELVFFDAVVETIHQPPDRRLASGPLVQRWDLVHWICAPASVLIAPLSSRARRSSSLRR